MPASSPLNIAHSPFCTRLTPLALVARLAIAAPLALGLVNPALAQSATRTIQYDIPASPLAEALNRFAQQSGVSIVMDANQLRHLRTPGLKGSHDVEGGFGMLLQGSGYMASKTAGGYVLRAAPAVRRGAEATLPQVQVTATPDTETATGPVRGYIARRSASATKTDTPLIETPQSITVVTRDQMDDQGATNVQDALNYAAGVRSEAYGLDGRTDTVRVRGSEPDQYLDGLRMTMGAYSSSARIDPYLLERLEVVRGPAGMLFGAGTVAGVVNMVSKRPQAETQREIGVQYGSWGRKQLQADLTGALDADGSLSYRLIALERKSGTQVDHVPNDRSLVSAQLSWRPSAATTLTLQTLWQKDKTGSTSQFFPWEGTVEPTQNGYLPTSRFIGEPGDGYDTQRKTFGWLLEHRVNDELVLRQNFREAINHNHSHYHYADYADLANSGTPGIWGLDPTNRREIGRFYWRSLTDTRMTALDNHAEWKLDAGSVRHTVLAGFDYMRQREHTRWGENSSSIDAYAPVYGVNFTPIHDGDLTSDPRTDQRQVGAYVQDQMKFGPWTVVAGLRQDNVVNRQEGAEDETSRATTHRLGAMYQLGNGWAPYVSYSESFTPLSGTDADLNRFKPQRGEQLEAGVKYLPANGNTSLTASVYDLKEKNRLVGDPVNPNYYRQIGESRTKGLELEAKTTLNKSLDLIANYNHTQLDAQLEGLPQNVASVWTRYRFAWDGLTGFSAGAGIRHLSSFRDTSNDSYGPQVGSVTLLDLMLAYERPQWRYALNVNNATDKTYLSTCLSRGDCWYGTRRNVVASATYRF